MQTSNTVPAPRGESWRTELFDLPAYFDAIGVARGEPSLEMLTRLHEAHVHTFPFANVDVLLGRARGVDPETVQDQLVRRRRGGYCFEHAQIFAAALEHLGFTIRRALGRVHRIDNSRTHMSVVAHVEGRRWLCDPGFGFSLTAPIELTDGATRDENGRTLTVHRYDDGGSPVWALDRDGATQHFTDEHTVHPIDVHTGHFVTSRSTHAPFTQHLTVMKHTDDGHVTLTENALTVRRRGDDTEHRELSVDDVVNRAQELGVRLQTGEDRLLAEALTRIR
ncbi:MAG TPA: arylamine N-acetyltransferase [Candidatus Dietzia intestinipullorum]|nr:arylamine N-acetyltransferase [Candidatus Dietzia merdigallinarum]HJC28741.1 arylamine N-acetyltransferase [Candidatus Dietzia intestinipullorum]